jgi:hypothetical protein
VETHRATMNVPLDNGSLFLKIFRFLRLLRSSNPILSLVILGTGVLGRGDLKVGGDVGCSGPGPEEKMLDAAHAGIAAAWRYSSRSSWR